VRDKPKRPCCDCDKLSDLLFAANEREGKKIKENAALQNERDQLANENVRLLSRLYEAEARRQVGG
jgi:cell shape-determining protein MreC